jgi:hypothetical protein
MPQIIVIADSPAEDGTAQVMLRERVTKRDFESGHFAAQLSERLGWAVGDAHAVDHRLRLQAADVVADADDGVSAETLQRSSARVVTTAS